MILNNFYQKLRVGQKKQIDPREDTKSCFFDNLRLARGQKFLDLFDFMSNVLRIDYLKKKTVKSLQIKKFCQFQLVKFIYSEKTTQSSPYF